MDNLIFNPALHVECGSSSPNLQSKENSYSEEPSNKCKFCGRGFQRSSHLQRHERNHTGERPYKCTICGRGFMQSSSLKIHKRTHTGERPYKCEFCGRTFTEKSNLHVHERTHTGERPYKCKFCDHTFIAKGNLHAHERTHTRERPYKCKFCGHSFTQNGSLKKHLRKLHSFAYSSTNRNSGCNTEFLQNCGPVNVTSNFVAQNFNLNNILYVPMHIDSTSVYQFPQASTSQVYVLENRNYASTDAIYKCELGSYFLYYI